MIHTYNKNIKMATTICSIAIWSVSRTVGHVQWYGEVSGLEVIRHSFKSFVIRAAHT